MSPLIAGRAKFSGVSAEALATGATALEAALETGGSELPASAVAAARPDPVHRDLAAGP